MHFSVPTRTGPDSKSDNDDGKNSGDTTSVSMELVESLADKLYDSALEVFRKHGIVPIQWFVIKGDNIIPIYLVGYDKDEQVSVVRRIARDADFVGKIFEFWVVLDVDKTEKDRMDRENIEVKDHPNRHDGVGAIVHTREGVFKIWSIPDSNEGEPVREW